MHRKHKKNTKRGEILAVEHPFSLRINKDHNVYTLVKLHNEPQTIL